MSATEKALTHEPAVLRPDLNGLIMYIPGQTALYLILDGYKCHIPTVQTLQNLFVPNPVTTPDPSLNEITTGNPITNGAVLAQAAGTAGVYLISAPPAPLNAAICKMGIVSPAIFGRYQFNWETKNLVAPVIIEAIPTGPNVAPATP